MCFQVLWGVLRVRYTYPPARNPFLREKPFLLLLLLTWSCSHHGRFSISSPVCHCCLQQQREDWQPLQNMTNMRQPEWDAYSPRALISHAPSHAFLTNPQAVSSGDGAAGYRTPHIGCRLSQNRQQVGVTEKGTNIIYMWTPAPVSWDWGGLNMGEAFQFPKVKSRVDSSVNSFWTKTLFFFLSNQPKCRKRTVFTVPQLCQNLKLQNSPSHTFSPFVSQLQLKDKMTQKWKFYYHLLPLKLMGSRVKFQEKAATRFHREAPETSPHFPAACRQAERTITEFIL